MPVRRLKIPVESVVIPDGRRKPADSDRRAMAASLSILGGVINPITVRRIDGSNTYQLVAGRTRLEGAIAAEKAEIDATVIDVPNGTAELVEIEENLRRRNLSPIEIITATARAATLYASISANNNSTPTGGKVGSVGKSFSSEEGGNSAIGMVAPTRAVADATGTPERTVRQRLATAKGLSKAAATIIRDLPTPMTADDIERLTCYTKDEQLRVVQGIADGTYTNVTAARDSSQEKAAEPAGTPRKRRRTKPKAAGDKPAPREPGDEQTDTDIANAQVGIWAAAVGRWLGQSPSIDEYRAAYPGPKGDRVVAAAKELFEALKVWQRAIK